MATLAILNKKKLNAKATKEKKVDEIAAIAKTAKVVAVISLRNLPDKQLQAFRKKLRGKATIMIAKNSVITRALAKAGKASELTTTMTTPSAVLFTDIDPFALYKTIVQSKGKAAAKPGQIAPFDLIVPKGETSFPPGPILTELKGAGIAAQIQAGKVVIGKDSIVAKKGDKITAAQSKALSKLEVMPFEVGVDIESAWENGVIYQKSVLYINEAEFMQKLQTAASAGLNLTVEIGYPTKMNIEFLVGKAHRSAKAVAVEAKIMNDETKELILAKATAEADALKAKLG